MSNMKIKPIHQSKPVYNDLMKRQSDKKPSKFAVELEKAKREMEMMK